MEKTKDEKPVNALTVDVEDYWSIFGREWLHQKACPTDAVLKNTRWFLQTLADHKTNATFFVLGDVAKAFPCLIREIAQQGHELGVHGFNHHQIFNLTPEQFRSEVSTTKKILEDISGNEVIGHRAPAFSINSYTKWALSILAAEGFIYDSSIFPIAGRRYGWPGFSNDICKIDLPSGKQIVEVPMSTVRIFGRNLPTAGGGYIRHFPYAITKIAIARIQKQRPAIVYMHPYEIETEDKPFEMQLLSTEQRKKAMHFHRMQMRNRSTVSQKLNRLLVDFSFTTAAKIIKVMTL